AHQSQQRRPDIERDARAVAAVDAAHLAWIAVGPEEPPSRVLPADLEEDRDDDKCEAIREPRFPGSLMAEVLGVEGRRKGNERDPHQQEEVDEQKGAVGLGGGW